MRRPTDVLLLQLRLDEAACGALTAALDALRSASPQPLAWQRLAYEASTQQAYLYGRLAARAALAAADAAPLADALSRLCPQARDVRVSRLERVFDVAGQAQGARPAFHYVVEMDPEVGWMPEISRWYDSEHMPGLAAVPGCVRAMRFLNHDHGPLSLACYDLATRETLNSPPWLAVRGTAWSDITRPHFTNTLRIMFEVLPA